MLTNLILFNYLVERSPRPFLKFADSVPSLEKVFTLPLFKNKKKLFNYVTRRNLSKESK